MKIQEASRKLKQIEFNNFDGYDWCQLPLMLHLIFSLEEEVGENLYSLKQLFKEDVRLLVLTTNPKALNSNTLMGSKFTPSNQSGDLLRDLIALNKYSTQSSVSVERFLPFYDNPKELIRDFQSKMEKHNPTHVLCLGKVIIGEDEEFPMTKEEAEKVFNEIREGVFAVQKQVNIRQLFFESYWLKVSDHLVLPRIAPFVVRTEKVMGLKEKVKLKVSLKSQQLTNNLWGSSQDLLNKEIIISYEGLILEK